MPALETYSNDIAPRVRTMADFVFIVEPIYEQKVEEFG